MKLRLDKYLGDYAFVKSRSRAADLVKRGLVRVNGKIVCKPSIEVDEGDEIIIEDEDIAYVSRAAKKLESAIAKFGLDPSDKICIDVGASTGGFTDVLLKCGAKKVYAVDVGINQIEDDLRQDSRVLVLEKINARYLDRTIIPEPIQVFVVDVSFISLTLILPALTTVLAENAYGICLIKPQFEAGKKALASGGIVKKESDRMAAIERVRAILPELGLLELGIIQSPISGSKGNVEYLIYLKSQLAAKLG